MERVKTVPRSRDNGGVVSRESDRPSPRLNPVINPHARRLVGEFTEAPLNPIKSLRTVIVGGGMSEKSKRTARKKQARHLRSENGVQPDATDSVAINVRPRKDATLPRVEKRLKDRRHVSADHDPHVLNGPELPYIKYEPMGVVERMHLRIREAAMPDAAILGSIVPENMKARIRAAIAF